MVRGNMLQVNVTASLCLQGGPQCALSSCSSNYNFNW